MATPEDENSKNTANGSARSVHTGGGSYIGGNVSASGDFIGGNQININRQEKTFLWCNVPPMPNTFVGRNEQIADLAAELTQGGSHALSAERE